MWKIVTIVIVAVAIIWAWYALTASPSATAPVPVNAYQPSSYVPPATVDGVASEALNSVNSENAALGDGSAETNAFAGESSALNDLGQSYDANTIQ